MTSSKIRIAAGTLSLLITPALSLAVIVIDSNGNPSRNLTAPSGALANSGWQYQGNWNGFSGTPIAAEYFITAKHVGGTVGQTFTLGDPTNPTGTYTTIAKYDDPNSDLSIWQISSTTPFTSWAPLYTKMDEVGQGAVIFGRGVPASGDVTVNNTLKGWSWTPSSYDGQRSWGQNIVDTTITDANLGRFLVTLFDHVAGQNEGQLAYADSGGGLFINDGGIWKLAGLDYGVDGPFKYALTDTTSFNAALFDMSGLYYETSPGVFSPAPNRPAASYYSSISGNLTWIENTVPGVPEPASLSLLLVPALLLLKRER